MLIKFPKDDKYFSWTRHIKNKMIFYGLSESRIKSVLKSPKRKEEGIAPNTTAVMKRNDRGKKKEEIWVMYATASQSQTNADLKRGQTQTETRTDARKSIATVAISQRKSAYSPRKSAARMLMISAWRYPGVSKPGKEIPIPADILNELEKII